MRRGAPAGVVLTTIFEISSMLWTCPLTRLSTSWWLFSKRPGESMRLPRAIASRMFGIRDRCFDQLRRIGLHFKFGPLAALYHDIRYASQAIQAWLDGVGRKLPQRSLWR